MVNNFCSHLNQIFYQHNKFDSPKTLDQLEKWMLTTEIYKISLLRSEVSPVSSHSSRSDHHSPLLCAEYNDDEKSLQEEISEVSVIAEISKVPVHSSIFAPNKEDTLFWCIYTLHHGEAGYWVIGNRYRNTEIQEKQTILEYIKANTPAMKRSGGTQHKISNVRIQETMAELMINKKTSWNTFWFLCAYYKIHALILFKKTYMEFLPTIDTSSSVDTFVFNRSIDGHISVNTIAVTPEYMENICQTHIRVDLLQERPLKAASSYKISELEDMANKLDISKESLTIDLNGSKPKKADWYNAILAQC